MLGYRSAFNHSVIDHSVIARCVIARCVVEHGGTVTGSGARSR
jgi:hypothetical protein